MTYVLHYASAAPRIDGTWAVYREEYPSLAESDGPPIEGSTRLVSTHLSEGEAYAEADRLQRVG